MLTLFQKDKIFSKKKKSYNLCVWQAMDFNTKISNVFSKKAFFFTALR